MQNGVDTDTATTAAQLDNSNACQLPLQAQAHSQSQIPVLQPCDSQKAPFGSVTSSSTQQKQLSTLTGAPGHVPTEADTEVWTHDSLLPFVVPTIIVFFVFIAFKI